MKEKNPWMVSLVSYSGPLLKKTREEFQQMIQKTRKLTMINKALYPQDNTNRLNVLRKETRTGLIRTEDSVDASIQELIQK